ncbi:cytochrome P450 [Emericellopsis atlantica]|uniref:Cytochrome P450 n=1 Tax=Emericellopsis atlantica TaxID=2614577 RepID=A0A9P8CTJ3_9HYPO|nr:cytochrome P450 [Emericellopsis atlantica]KAG9256891.1 cytochrome P450 [Emericellopsis atlantica]
MAQPIPQPKGLPLLGNVLDVKPSNTWASLKKLAETYGEIFKITVLGHSIVFVAGADLAEEVTDEKRFRKYVGGPIEEIRYAVHDALFTAYDHEASWGIAHRIIAPKLSPQAMRLHFEEMRDTTSELINLWKDLGDSSNKITLVEQLNRLNLEATTLTLYGKKLNGLEGKQHPMIQGMENSTAEAVMRPTRPGILNFLLYWRKFKRSTATMRAYAQDMVDYRKQNPTKREDLLSAMMEHKDPETGKSLTDSEIIDEIVSMPIGSSTAPCLITSAIYYLLKNPEVMAKAREEIHQVVGKETLTMDHIPKLCYGEGVVREALRLGHPAPGFNLEPVPSDNKSPIQLAGGKYEIPHDQPIILVLAGVNRDPTVFPDPMAFKPERMMSPEFEKLPRAATRWFGNGKRECIGKHYALLWNMIVLTMLLREIEFEMVDENYNIEQVGMDGWFNVRPINFQVKVRPRV